MNDEQKYIEARLRRSSTMSAEKIEALHKQNEALPVRVKCWNCHEYSEAVDIQTCSHCHVNLWSRDAPISQS